MMLPPDNTVRTTLWAFRNVPSDGVQRWAWPTSVRLPALPANRDYLRALRAAEMLAWEHAQPSPQVLRDYTR